MLVYTDFEAEEGEGIKESIDRFEKEVACSETGTEVITNSPPQLGSDNLDMLEADVTDLQEYVFDWTEEGVIVVEVIRSALEEKGTN